MMQIESRYNPGQQPKFHQPLLELQPQTPDQGEQPNSNKFKEVVKNTGITMVLVQFEDKEKSARNAR